MPLILTRSVHGLSPFTPWSRQLTFCASRNPTAHRSAPCPNLAYTRLFPNAFVPGERGGVRAGAGGARLGYDFSSLLVLLGARRQSYHCCYKSLEVLVHVRTGPCSFCPLQFDLRHEALVKVRVCLCTCVRFCLRETTILCQALKTYPLSGCLHAFRPQTPNSSTPVSGGSIGARRVDFRWGDFSWRDTSEPTLVLPVL